MKKDYNRDVVSDMPVDTSFTSPTIKRTTTKSTSKPKINAIGTQKRTTTKTSTANKNTSKSTASKVKESSANKKSIRTTLINSSTELDDLEKLNEESFKTFRYKSKRNKVIIALLSVLLVISIATIVTLFVVSKLKTNCNFYIHGDVDAQFIINGKEMKEFRAPSNLQGNRVFNFDVELRIHSGGSYKIKIIAKCYQKGVLMSNTLIYKHNLDLFYDGGDGYCYSKDAINGNQTIFICEGVILDYVYEDTLNVDNFKLDFHVYLEKV